MTENSTEPTVSSRYPGPADLHKTRPPKRSDFKHVFRALGYAFEGLWDAFTREAAFRHEFILGIILFPITLWLPFSTTLRIVLNALWISLLVTELINSAIEAIVDLVTPEWHPLAKQAKDMASAAVFCALIAFLASWIYALINM